MFDIHCETASGEKYIIEMQNDYQENFIQRSVYYASMAMASQGEKGTGWKYATQPVNTVSLLNFVLLKQFDQSIQRTITLTDVVTCKEFTDQLNFYYVEFPKFDKGIDELTTDLDRWLYLFTNLPKLKTRPAALQVGIFKEVLAMAEIAKMSADDQWAYQMSLKHKRDYNNVMSTARELGLEEGVKQGIEQGLEQGRALGVKQGLEQGLEKGEDVKAQKVAVKMLRKGGVSVNDIAEFIEKDIAFVEELKAQLDKDEI